MAAAAAATGEQREEFRQALSRDSRKKQLQQVNREMKQTTKPESNLLLAAPVLRLPAARAFRSRAVAGAGKLRFCWEMQGMRAQAQSVGTAESPTLPTPCTAVLHAQKPAARSLTAAAAARQAGRLHTVETVSHGNSQARPTTSGNVDNPAT